MNQIIPAIHIEAAANDVTIAAILRYYDLKDKLKDAKIELKGQLLQNERYSRMTIEIKDIQKSLRKQKKEIIKSGEAAHKQEALVMLREKYKAASELLEDKLREYKKRTGSNMIEDAYHQKYFIVEQLSLIE